MKYLNGFLIFLITTIAMAQTEFHVFPKDGTGIKGSPNGDGSINKPWDLQTALSQSSERVNGGDIIWLHEGIYNGNYKSILQSTHKDKFITVSAYKGHKVLLNGNIDNKTHYVLEVSGGRVIFKNFEITYLGEFSRIKADADFKAVIGVNHIDGEDCKFQNLVIHNMPGTGFGSWKATGGTVIEECIIYNNGYQGQRGQGVGIYVQNQSEKIRLLRNNIVFNNYYKGIEVWSASSGTNKEFVKNVHLEQNIIFNNGSPSGRPWANLIVASGDRNGVNVAKHVTIRDNVFYHNVDFNDFKNYGHGNSLTLGFSVKAPIEDIVVDSNFIIGRNNALNIVHAKSLELKNNTIYTGYTHFEKSTLTSLEAGRLKFDNNKYHSRKVKGLRILKYKDFKLADWKNKFAIDVNSQWKPLMGFNVDPLLKIERLQSNPNQFNIALLEKEGNDVIVDFSNLEIKEGVSYNIYDIENRKYVLKSGKLPENKKVKFPMKLTAFERPLLNTIATKSASNFGVYRIVFEDTKKEIRSF